MKKLHDITREWWSGLLQDHPRLIRWLLRLHQAEAGGAERFQMIVSEWQPEGIELENYLGIITDELAHQVMVEEVLTSRSVVFPSPPMPERYWDPVWNGVTDFRTACAAGTFGEMLALNRFRVIVEHPDTPDDIRALAQAIMPDEQRHARLLREMAGKEAMDLVRPFHQKGKVALGLAGVDDE